MGRVELMTLTEFCEHYGTDNGTAKRWIESGTAPGMLIPGTRRYHIPRDWVARFDRGEPGRWHPTQETPEAPVTLVQFRRVS
jgi:hypothetical protein